MEELTATHFLLLSAALFIIGMVGVLTRRNVLVIGSSDDNGRRDLRGGRLGKAVAREQRARRREQRRALLLLVALPARKLERGGGHAASKTDCAQFLLRRLRESIEILNRGLVDPRGGRDRDRQLRDAEQRLRHRAPRLASSSATRFLVARARKCAS